MKNGLLTALIASLGLIVGRLPAQRVPQLSSEFTSQMRATAKLSGLAPFHVDSATPHHSSSGSNRVIIAAAIGAVALPAIGYLILHDRDGGRPQIGTLLPIAAIGAFLGAMVGLATKH